MSVSNLMGVGISAGAAKLITGILADNLTATGSSQADALPLPGDINVVAFVNGTGTKLPNSPQPGDEILISNLSGSDIKVYPYPGQSINGGATDAPFTLPTGASVAVTARKGSMSWIALGSAPVVVAANSNNIGQPLGLLLALTKAS